MTIRDFTVTLSILELDHVIQALDAYGDLLSDSRKLVDDEERVEIEAMLPEVADLLIRLQAEQERLGE